MGKAHVPWVGAVVLAEDEKIAIVTDAETESEIKPCKACLQCIFYLAENPEIKIVMAKVDGDKILFETLKVKPLKELLSKPFKK